MVGLTADRLLDGSRGGDVSATRRIPLELTAERNISPGGCLGWSLARWIQKLGKSSENEADDTSHNRDEENRHEEVEDNAKHCG